MTGEEEMERKEQTCRERHKKREEREEGETVEWA